ncbi:MAG: S49 family peptidase [Alphaproteobacteria bacterium]|nr:S49 family peptidase [Alphaproteobacteria bacterium]
MLRRIGRFFLAILATVGALVVASIGFWLFVILSDSPAPMPSRVLLTLDLDKGVAEAPADTPLALVTGQHDYVLRDVVDALAVASADPRVQGLFVTLDGAKLPMAQAQELRRAVLAFRQAGKKALVFSHTLGEMGPATIDYYLASAFGEIWLQPSGDLAITGFRLESPFLNEALVDLGIQPQVAARHEFKSAHEIVTRTGFSREAKATLGGLIDSWVEQVVAGIAETRKLDPAVVRKLIDTAPLMAAEAKDAGLVDRLGYAGDARLALAPDEVDRMDVRDYLDRAGRPGDKADKKIALIYGVGQVMLGGDEGGAFDDGSRMTVDKLVGAFRDAALDEDVEAILFRVDSPGGSYVASDAIYDAVREARAAGKPVVVSMGNMAASGGYFVSMPASLIFAEPGTVTGSIGVFAGKVALAEFWPKLGIHWDSLERGANSSIWSLNEPFSESAWARLNLILDRIYADFTGKVGQTRNLTPEKLDEVARGRVWSGADAHRLGLVDRLGGLGDGLAAAKELAGLPPGREVAVTVFPKPKRPIVLLFEALEAGGVTAHGLGVLATRLNRLGTIAEPLLRGVETRPGALRAPDLR